MRYSNESYLSFLYYYLGSKATLLMSKKRRVLYALITFGLFLILFVGVLFCLYMLVYKSIVG